MNENEELQSGFPDWLTEDYKVLEPVFCRTFLREHPMRCIRGRFYTVDGLVADESSLKKKIYEQISPWLETKIARKVDELLNALRMAAYSEPIELECDRIHVANGTLFTDGRFAPEKAYCNNSERKAQPVKTSSFRKNALRNTKSNSSESEKKVLKSNLRNEIKAYIVRQGMTMQEVVDILSDVYGWSDSVSNLSNKLQRESLRYKEAVQLADVLGYNIQWVRRKDA